MEFKNVVKERRSIRRFKAEPVSHEVMEKIVEVARFAPSWKNTQIAHYIVVDSPELKAKIATPECTYNFTYNIGTLQSAASIVILTFEKGRSGYDRDGSYSTEYEDRWQNFDCGIAAQTFCLAAYEEGVGSVIMGYFDEGEIRRVLDLPENMGVGAVIACGYPDEAPACPRRKEVSELLSFK